MPCIASHLSAYEQVVLYVGCMVIDVQTVGVGASGGLGAVQGLVSPVEVVFPTPMRLGRGVQEVPLLGLVRCKVR